MFDYLLDRKLPKIQIGNISLYKLDIPCPPQLYQAVGYFESNTTIGIWIDNHKVTVSDGYQTTTSSNPGWDKYCNYPPIASYLYALRAFGSSDVDLYGEFNSHGVARHGFLIKDYQIYLATVKEITKILKNNADLRPDWIRNATESDLFNPEWQARYLEYSQGLKPAKTQEPIQDMLQWLDLHS